jgi:hypothetical protein
MPGKSATAFVPKTVLPLATLPKDLSCARKKILLSASVPKSIPTVRLQRQAQYALLLQTS